MMGNQHISNVFNWSIVLQISDLHPYRVAITQMLKELVKSSMGSIAWN